ncbi:MAG: helix-turn-helix domain-containing protein [Blautia sp.]|nr:helix-turn-helix domain-containing protein [Blautia sp.]
MKLMQLLKSCLDEWTRITGIAFALVYTDGGLYLATTENETLPSASLILDFVQDEALCRSFGKGAFYKVFENGRIRFVLICYGQLSSLPTLGELAVCQVESLLSAGTQKPEKTTFIQSLLLNTCPKADAYNLARQLRIDVSVPRVVFLIQTRQQESGNALTTLKNIFAGRSKDTITTSAEAGSILLVRELSQDDSYDSIEGIAHMIVDMLGSEAMTSAWVSYSSLITELCDLPKAYQEARTAMEVGRIFMQDKSTFGYRKLGIGRLIYQLPLEICDLFVNEVFDPGTLEELDEETLSTIRILFENNLNLSETSRQLYVHRNTLVYRFEKLQKRLGLDVRTFEDALTFKLAMMVVDFVKSQSNRNS